MGEYKPSLNVILGRLIYPKGKNDECKSGRFFKKSGVLHSIMMKKPLSIIRKSDIVIFVKIPAILSPFDVYFYINSLLGMNKTLFEDHQYFVLTYFAKVVCHA